MNKKTSTQSFLQNIEQIREGIVILDNKSLRGILMVSSLNFSLKSQEEQQAIVYQFQSFINSLDFSCQIVIQSRKLNLNPYIEKMKDIEKKHTRPLLKKQTGDYIEFVKNLVDKENILTKSFFLVVPYDPSGTQNISKRGESISEEAFQRGKDQVWQKLEFVSLGLRRCGLRSVPLTTIELIELFWSLYHPREAELGYYPEFPSELII